MCVRTGTLAPLLIGVGAGLLLSLILQGWFPRIVVSAVLLAVGNILSDR